MSKLPAEIRLKTKNLPKVIQEWAEEYMEWHGVKGTYFVQHIIVSYWENQIREKVQKIEFVNSLRQTSVDSQPLPENTAKSPKFPEIPKTDELVADPNYNPF